MRNFIRPLIALIAASIAAVGVIAFGPATTANADPGTPNCMTRSEYRQIHTTNGWYGYGDTRAQVRREVGNGGRVTDYDYDGGYNDIWVDYRECNRRGQPTWRTVEINFDNYSYNDWSPSWSMRAYSKSRW